MFPKLLIDLGKIRNNSYQTTQLASGIEIFGVTKAVLGSTEIAGAMVDGGVAGLADSRLSNLVKLRNNFDVPLIMLRQPMLAEIDRAVDVADIIIVTELVIIEMIASRAQKIGKTIKLLIMFESGDGREGVLNSELPLLLDKILRLKGIEVYGFALNVGCSFGIKPTKDQLLQLVKSKNAVEKRFKKPVKILSGGNSGSLRLILDDELPPEVNQLRIGEAILLGHETADYSKLDKFETDAFVVEAEVIELKEKNIDGSSEWRAVVAIGRQDVGTGPLVTTYGQEINKSSDHLVLSPCDSEKMEVGQVLKFNPSYFTILAAMTSPYVDKEFIGL